MSKNIGNASNILVEDTRLKQRKAIITIPISCSNMTNRKLMRVRGVRWRSGNHVIKNIIRLLKALKRSLSGKHA